MSPTDAITKLELVFKCTAWPMVMHTKSGCKTWNPDGFDGNKLLLGFLSGKLASFSKAAEDSEPPSIDEVENRLISALAITLLVTRYGNMPLSNQQWKSLLDGLQLPVHLEKRHALELMKSISNAYASQKRDIILGLERLCQNSKLQLAGKGNKYNWVLVLPMLHFFRNDCTPWTDVAMTMEYVDPKWWGVGGLGIDEIKYISDKDANMIQEIQEALFPFFDMDRLLRRSFLWLQLTPAGLQQFLKSQLYPLGLMCSALDVVLSKLQAHKDQVKSVIEDIQLLCNQVTKMSEDNNSKDQISMESCIHLTKVASEVTKNALKKANKSELHSLMVNSCYLFAACYNLCFVSQTGSQHSHMQHVEGYLEQLQKDVAKWLVEKLPTYLSTSDGKALTFPEELNVWHSLLSITLVEPHVADNWNQTLVNLLKDKVKRLSIEQKIDLWAAIDVTDKHGDISKIFIDAAFDALNQFLMNDKGDKNVFAKVGEWINSKSEKIGALFSSFLLKSWPKPRVRGQDVDEMQLLEHVLRWTPFVNYFNFRANDNAGFTEILSAEARSQLDYAKSIFISVSEAVQDGSLFVKQLQLITTDGQCRQQFKDLYKIMACAKQGSSVDEKPQSGAETKGQIDRHDKMVVRLLNTRKRELDELQHQRQLNQTLVAVCCTIAQVDCHQVEQKLRTDVCELQLNKVCMSITMQQLEQHGLVIQPTITLFSHPRPVQEVLEQLHMIHECKVFKKLLKSQAAEVRSKKAEPAAVLSILEVATQVFGPVYNNQLIEVITKLSTEAITLGEVDNLFRDIISRPEILQSELQMLARMRPKSRLRDAVWVAKKLNKIQEYYQVQHQAQAAGELLKIRDAFVLKGNFKPMETLNNVNAQASKNHPLSAINEDVIQAANILRNVGEKEVECLKQLTRCKELINWVRQEIKVVQALKVFVDLAMIAAGETDIEVDRVSCFHRAATGYAPFIFELKDCQAGYRELLSMAQKVWKALKTDQHLPQKLRDTQRQLIWLKQVKDSHGSVETSSLRQAEAINSGGVYTIGNLKNTATIELCVAMREINEDGKEEENERVYTLEKLRDLQSKLTLVAGKTQEDRQGLQAKVEQFVQVFTAAQQLASTYTKLNSAGCILFKEWKAVLYCSSLGKVSVLVDFGASEQLLLKGTRPLMVELRFLREFMDECLTQWHHYVDEQRSKCYELNYYTTEQLVMLRQNLAQFTTNKKDLPAQIYVLLSSVKQMCNPDDIDVALKAAMRQVALEAAPAPMEAEAIDAPEVNEADVLNQKKLLAKKLVDEFLFEESMALAAVEAVGLEYADGGLEEYLDWCLQNEQNAELIQELVTGLQAQGIRLSDDMTDEATIGKEMDYDDDISRLAAEEEMSFPSMALSVHELTESLLRDVNRGDLNNQLKQLWQNHLHSMKSMDVEDCLSLEHLGIILHHLNQANSHQPDRKFPTFLKTGQPNLIVRSAGDIWTTVLSLYMHEGGHLPTQEEVLICNTATTLEQVLLLWRRALSDQLNRVFCLVRADLLDYDVSVKAEQQLLHLMQGKAGYHLVILSSSEREDSSHIVTALDQYRVDIPGMPPIADIQHYLRQELEAQAQSVQNITRVHPAAMITPHGCTVEVIVSSRPGVGKSLAIKRYAQKLCKHLGRNSGDKVLVTMPLQTAQVEEDIVVSALLPYQQASYTTSPRIFHLDIAPMVKDGLDHLLFNLLILGGLCNSHGKAWKRKPQDLYVVEITDFTLQHRHSRHSSKHTTHPFYALLPSVTCRAPQEVLYAMHRSAVWPKSDPKVDEEEFKSEAYQRTFQYLMKREQNANLDDFNFQSNSVEGTRKQFLETLLRNCGVIDPSWAELRHFAHFLSIQLQDCQQSTFCIPELLADTGLQGFKSFVVKFMVQMAKDFATPSLNMSEESPSKARLLLGNNDGRGNGQQADIPELAAFQLRRRWESSFHPYIFFNHDHESMTFMGFIINQQGSLIDPTRRQIIEPGLMTPELRGRASASASGSQHRL
ncbi:E3 ubiquitin-protein ligase rnf213-alpha-like [Amphiura filiformis]|uniref:E3 ubiquitin-protein ligase rnf213-alpha-like n=1 Tax=Amphiura filiformis TaxID=82378 RepID=UPI003B20BC8F